jgi:hypothetical protein
MKITEGGSGTEEDTQYSGGGNKVEIGGNQI